MSRFTKIKHFIQYNNAFTIGFVLVFFGFGAAFAASPDLRGSVYSSSQTVGSVDNRLIVAADLDNLDFHLQISSVTEDSEKYYIGYNYQGLTLENSVWQNKTLEKTLTVSKAALEGRDLGLYVAKELSDNLKSELAYLKRVQRLEKERGVSQRTVTVQYAGLIGRFLDSHEVVLEGYDPVIPETPEPTPTPTPENSPVSSPTPEVAVATSTPVPTPTPGTQGIDPELIRRIVEEYLAQHNVQGTPTPAPTATATPEPSATPEITPEPSISPSETPSPEVTPPSDN